MNSMTGYASKEQITDDNFISVEVRSLNNKFLDININCPFYLNPYEAEIRKIIQNRIKRGRIDIFIRIREKQSPLTVSVDMGLAKQYNEAFNKLINDFDLQKQVYVREFLYVGNVVKTEETRKSNELWNISSPIIKDTIDELFKSRNLEGATIKQDLLKIITLIKDKVNIINQRIPLIKDELYTRLKTKMADFLSTEKLDENRIAMEAGIISQKADVNEEISRLISHISLFEKTIDEDIPVGKKLDFIAQEMFREINTLSTKSQDSSTIEHGINIKNMIEQLREQTRNIE